VPEQLTATSIPALLRRGAVTVAAGRVALGLTALAWPAVPARPWVGASADDLAARVFGRALGGRDLALGLGALAALARLGEAGIARPHIVASSWTVPLTWFVPFAPAERWLSLGDGRGGAGADRPAGREQHLGAAQQGTGRHETGHPWRLNAMESGVHVVPVNAVTDGRQPSGTCSAK